MTPHGALKTLVHGQDTLILDGLGDTVDHAIVSASRSLVLQADLDELEGDDDEGFSGTGSSTSKNGERLVHLVYAEHLTVNLAPFVVGGELGGTLGGFH